MKTDEQNVAIAKAMGFSWQTWGKGDLWTIYPISKWLPKGWTRPSKEPSIFPCRGRNIDEVAHELLSQIKFTSDLDMMHDAWRLVVQPIPSLTDAFENHLRVIAERDSQDPARDKFYALVTNATASQRAEAFLKTLGLWKEAATTPTA